MLNYGIRRRAHCIGDTFRKKLELPPSILGENTMLGAYVLISTTYKAHATNYLVLGFIN